MPRNERDGLSLVILEACEDSEQFVEYRLGQDEFVSLADDARKRRLSPAARKNQRRDQNVGVEGDLYRRR